MTTVREALNESLEACLRESSEVYFLGEDILDPYGGAFKLAAGLSTQFPARVVTTPVSEAGIVGVGIGMALRGLRPVVEIMFGDFIALAADQLINHAAKIRWMSGDAARVPLVVRTPMGGGRGYGPTHSQTLEKHFLGAPGLRVVAVTDMDDPGALLRRAVIHDDDPVLLVEHKLLYPSTILALDETGEFDIERQGVGYPTYLLRLRSSPEPELTLVAYGYMAALAREAMRDLAYEKEIFSELIVPTQLSPFELDDLYRRASQTRRVLVIEEGTRTMGWGAEVSARLHEAVPSSLQVGRVAALDMPIPAAARLEAEVLPSVARIKNAAQELVV
ncbi:MAG: transketolase C-terminal domain-containing protein [Anaerolineales bacterium]|jgi:pyruvate/2-oxoglutarate/acetoin dehydrogenase E1 component